MCIDWSLKINIGYAYIALLTMKIALVSTRFIDVSEILYAFSA